MCRSVGKLAKRSSEISVFEVLSAQSEDDKHACEPVSCRSHSDYTMAYIVYYTIVVGVSSRIIAGVARAILISDQFATDQLLKHVKTGFGTEQGKDILPYIYGTKVSDNVREALGKLMYCQGKYLFPS